MSKVISFADYDNVEKDETGKICAVILEHIQYDDQLEEYIKLKQTTRMDVQPTMNAADAVTQALREHRLSR